MCVRVCVYLWSVVRYGYDNMRSCFGCETLSIRLRALWRATCSNGMIQTFQLVHCSVVWIIATRLSFGGFSKHTNIHNVLRAESIRLHARWPCYIANPSPTHDGLSLEYTDCTETNYGRVIVRARNRNVIEWQWFRLFRLGIDGD